MTFESMVAERIKKLRIDKKLNQKEFANLINTTQDNISRIENNKKAVDINTLKEIAIKLEVPTDYLLGLSPADTNKPDIKAMCDYLNLSTETLEDLRFSAFNSLIKCELVRTSYILNIAINDDYFALEKFTQYHKTAKSNVISSKAFRSIISASAFGMLIKDIADYILNLSDEEIEKVSLDSEQVDMLIEFEKRYYKEYCFEIFEAQNDIRDFIAQELAPLPDDNLIEEQINKLIISRHNKINELKN